MEHSMYSYEIKKVIENLDLTNEDTICNLISNVVAYCISENTTKANWFAHELLNDVIENEKIIEIFDEEQLTTQFQYAILFIETRKQNQI